MVEVCGFQPTTLKATVKSVSEVDWVILMVQHWEEVVLEDE